MFTVARQVRRIVDFTTDRDELRAAGQNIFIDTGAGAVIIDGLFETWDRFEDDDFWPVFVVVGHDGAESSGFFQEREYDEFVSELMDRGVNAHAVMVSVRGGAIQTDIARNLTANTGGSFQLLQAATALDDYLGELATKIGQHHAAMSNRYRVVYERESDDDDAQVTVAVTRPAVAVRIYLSRRMEP